MRQKAPSAKRCIKTIDLEVLHSLANGVRKHRAPNGALRQLVSGLLAVGVKESQKAPSAKRRIKTPRCPEPKSGVLPCQKAPNAKRCIKTWRPWSARDRCRRPVRKHQAPKGALKPEHDWIRVELVELRQKAPSTKRCIKTVPRDRLRNKLRASESTECQKVH